MSQTTHTYQYTLQLIADILSFNYSADDLKRKLSNDQIDWEQFVTVASDHLVLTACYCRLKKKKALENIPSDLSAYMKHITSINRQRNLSLIEEAKAIAEIFNSENINYTFLKGMAFLIGDYYQDEGERMIGDIDILVDEYQIQKAFDLMTTKGYSKMPSSIRATFFDHKHLDRLTKEGSLCAVELHKYVLNSPKQGCLKSSYILNTRKHVKATSITGYKSLFIHNILNFQINDKGHYYSKISMRSFYDTLVLLHKSPELITIHKNKYVISYLSLMSIYFKELLTDFTPNQHIIKTYALSLKNHKLYRVRIKFLEFLSFLELLPSRFILFAKNKHYRVAVFNNRKRIMKELKSKFIRS